jgi:hypothetical protein
MTSMSATTQKLLSYPFFILLHILFTLSSLLLRFTQSFHNPHPPTPAPSRSRGISEVERLPPKHVALSLVSSSAASGSSKQRGRERIALAESLIRVMRWAGNEGVQEVSVYTDLGE